MENRPLTTEEIRANASKWTLACDVGLLAHLQQLSDKMVAGGKASLESVQKLEQGVEQTSTVFNNVSNQFLSLQNSQFLENRVCDDDSSEIEKKPQVAEKVPSQAETLECYRQAALTGLELLDTHYEQVQLLETSDSEDEQSGSDSTLLLRAKLPYAQPLPLLIGSAEWWADDNVGLGAFEENVDSEPIVSLSESETDDMEGGSRKTEKRVRMSTSSLSDENDEESPPKKPAIPTTITIPPGKAYGDSPSSEDLFRAEDSGLFATGGGAIFHNDSAEEPEDLFGCIQKSPVLHDKKFLPPREEIKKPAPSDGDLFADAADPVQAPVNNRIPNDFTKELVAKLGNVANKQDVVDSTQAVKRPTTVVPKNTQAAQSNTFAPSHAKPPPVGIFDDNDDEDEDSLFTGAKVNLFAPTSAFSDEVSAIKSRSSGLFDDDDGTDWFESIPENTQKKKKTVLFDDDVEVNDDNLFGTKDASKSSSDGSKETKSVGPKTPVPAMKVIPSSPALVTSVIRTPNKQTKSLFDDDYDDDDLFLVTPKPKSSHDSTSKVNERSLLQNKGIFSSDSVNQSPGIKSSTPAVNDISSEENLSISDVDPFSNSRDASSLEVDGSRDRAFIVVSTESDSGNDASLNVSDADGQKDSRENWFQPPLMSTQNTSSGGEQSSGYHTKTSSRAISKVITTSQESRRESANAQRLAVPQEEEEEDDLLAPKLSGHLFDNLCSISKPQQSDEADDLFSNVGTSKVMSSTATSSAEPPPLLKSGEDKQQTSRNSNDDLFPRSTALQSEKLSHEVLFDSVSPAKPPLNSGMGRSLGQHVSRSDDADDDLFSTSKNHQRSSNDDDLISNPRKSTSKTDMGKNLVQHESGVDSNSKTEDLFGQEDAGLSVKAQQSSDDLFSTKSNKDLFSNTKKPTSTEVGKPLVQHESSSKTADLFGREDTGLGAKVPDDSDDLFSTKSTTKKPLFDIFSSPAKSSKLVFDNDSDDDDSLFSSAPSKPPDAVSVSSSRSSFDNQSIGKLNKKSSLFQELEDDKATDDLFAVSATTAVDDSNLKKSVGEPSLFEDGKTKDDLFAVSAATFDESSNVKKNVGSNVGEPNLFDGGKTRDDLFAVSATTAAITDESNNVKENDGSNVGEASLFEDGKAKDDLFAVSAATTIDESSNAKKSIGSNAGEPSLFKGLKDSKTSDDLFAASATTTATFDSKQKKNTGSNVGEPSLFDKASPLVEESSNEDADLFSGTTPLIKQMPKEKDSKATDTSTIKPATLPAKSGFKPIEDDLFSDKTIEPTSKIKNKEESPKKSPPPLPKGPKPIFKDSDDDLFHAKEDEPNFTPKKAPPPLPSGPKPKFQDFLDDDLFQKKEETNVTPKKSPPPLPSGPKPKFQDFLDDDDLFSGTGVSSPPPVLPVKPSKKSALNSKQSPPREVYENTKKTESPVPTPPQKGKPPDSLNIVKNSDLLKGIDEKDGEIVKTAVTKKIGKLNIPGNLKINPMALIPGARPVKRDENRKSTEATGNTEEVRVIPKDSTEAEPSKPLLKNSSPNKVVTPPTADFSSPVQVSENSLGNMVRNRARIQVKRKPQTRRARQEALKTSGMDSMEETSPGPSGSDSSLFQSADSSPSTIISPSTDEEDIFHVPELDSQEQEDFFKKDLTTSKPEKALFDGAPVISPLEKSRSPERIKDAIVKPENPLFDGGPLESTSPFINIPRQSSDEELFSSKSSHNREEKEATSTLPDLFSNVDIEATFPKVSPKAIKPKLPPPKALFTDDDDDSLGIFSGSSSVPKPTKDILAEKTAPKKDVDSAVSSTTCEPFVDPLGLNPL